jgi:hypothetical protein
VDWHGLPLDDTNPEPSRYYYCGECIAPAVEKAAGGRDTIGRQVQGLSRG